jgi:hypothetical protein
VDEGLVEGRRGEDLKSISLFFFQPRRKSEQSQWFDDELNSSNSGARVPWRPRRTISGLPLSLRPRRESWSGFRIQW